MGESQKSRKLAWIVAAVLALAFVGVFACPPLIRAGASMLEGLAKISEALKAVPEVKATAIKTCSSNGVHTTAIAWVPEKDLTDEEVTALSDRIYRELEAHSAEHLGDAVYLTIGYEESTSVGPVTYSSKHRGFGRVYGQRSGEPDVAKVARECLDDD